MLVCALAATAAADPQFVTLERVDREARLGLQASFQLYPDLPDGSYGLRTELYAQFAGALRGGSYIGGYGHLAVAFPFTEDVDDENAIGDLELGGYYITRMGSRSDLAFHFGLTLPTASDGGRAQIANTFTSLERNYDIIDSFRDTTALNVGVSLRTPLGASAFLQGDFALDLPINKPGPNSPFFHANLGVGAWLGSSVALMGELATTFSDKDDGLGFLGSVAVGLRFRGAAHPHIAYIYAFEDDSGPNSLTAHIISFGFYASL
jgi:hypothetical protein